MSRAVLALYMALMALLTSSSVVWLTAPRWATVTAFCAALMRSSTIVHIALTDERLRRRCVLQRAEIADGRRQREHHDQRGNARALRQGGQPLSASCFERFCCCGLNALLEAERAGARVLAVLRDGEAPRQPGAARKR